jgi:hypothetical protein
MEFQGKFRKDEQTQKDGGWSWDLDGLALCHSNAKIHEGKGKQAGKVCAPQKGRIRQSDQIGAQALDALQPPPIRSSSASKASAAHGVSSDASASWLASAKSWSLPPSQ